MAESISRAHWLQYSITTLIALMGVVGLGGLKGLFTKPDAQGVTPAPAPSLVSTASATTPPLVSRSAETPFSAPTALPRVVEMPPAATPFPPSVRLAAPPTPNLPMPRVDTHRLPSWRLPEVKTKSFPNEPKDNPQYSKADGEMNRLFGKIHDGLNSMDARNFLMEQRAWLNERTKSWDRGGVGAVIGITLQRNAELRERFPEFSPR